MLALVSGSSKQFRAILVLTSYLGIFRRATLKSDKPQMRSVDLCNFGFFLLPPQMILHGTGVLVQMGMADIQTQLSTLLGREVRQVRKTDEVPPRISVIHVAVVITGKDANRATQDVGFVKDRHPEVTHVWEISVHNPVLTRQMQSLVGTRTGVR